MGYSYLYNNANQRVRATAADGAYWEYTYDALGQVNTGRKLWSDGTQVAGQQFEYNFDAIGNRSGPMGARTGGDALGGSLRDWQYTPNYLNQYDNRTVPRYVQSLGTANPQAAVWLWSTNGLNAPTSRKGSYFRGELFVGGTNSLLLSVTNIAVLTTGATEVVSREVRTNYLPAAVQTFSYDLDGNLTNDGRWSYIWDAENRLAWMVVNNAVVPPQRVQFEYDWQGRRIRKRVWNNTAGTGTPAVDLRFVYDGWNPVATLTSAKALRMAFVWGLDLSGTPQGAGGVGGLLKVTYYGTQTTNAFVAYDGNGNVIGLLDAATGAQLGAYEYGPFGEVIRATGPMARVNPFRWSTQYTDDETDLVMYPARPYSPSTGRFLSRDRIEEEGGLNLYGFVENDPVNFVDPFGEEILVIAGRHKFNGTTFPLESVQSNWGIKHFANQVRRAFQEIVGDCAKLELADAGTDRISVPTSSGTKTLERKRFRITFSGEKASCKCNDCWQLLKRAIQDTRADIEIRFLVDRDNAAYMPPDDSVYINPGVNVPLFEQSPKGGYRKKPVPFPIVLWHEGIGHDYQGFGHPDIPANRTPTWDGVYMDPTIREENRARNCTRLAGERYGGFLGLFGRSLGDRIPTYYGNPNTPTYP